MLSNICVPPGNLNQIFSLLPAVACLAMHLLVATSAPGVGAFQWVCIYSIMPESVGFTSFFSKTRLPLEFTWGSSQKKWPRASKRRLKHQSPQGSSRNRVPSAACSLHGESWAPWTSTQPNRKAYLSVGQLWHLHALWAENMKGHWISES